MSNYITAIHLILNIPIISRALPHLNDEISVAKREIAESKFQEIPWKTVLNSYGKLLSPLNLGLDQFLVLHHPSFLASDLGPGALSLFTAN